LRGELPPRLPVITRLSLIVVVALAALRSMVKPPSSSMVSTAY